MNKFIAWNEDSGMALTINSIKDLIPSPFKHSSLELFKSTGKTDIHGNEIYYDFHIVKFKYNAAFAIWVEHIGVFRYNKDELRGEIDISDQRDCICLWYDSSIMSNLEIIGNVKENPELIGEGKL
jgi:hypothetical protein